MGSRRNWHSAHDHPSWITDYLYLSAAKAINAQVLIDLGITYIVNATIERETGKKLRNIRRHE